MARSEKLTKNAFSTIEALAAAVAAFEAAGNTVIRYGEKSVFPDSVGNKEMIQGFLTEKQGLTVTDTHRTRSEEMRTWLSQKLTMNLLSSTASSSFFVEICKIVSGENVQYRNVGLLAWAPKLYADMLAKEEREQDIREACGASSFIGQLGKPVEISITVKERHYMRDFGKFRIVAVDQQNNLLQFYITNLEADHVTVKARVKNHVYSTHFRGLPVTQLNYVKIVAG